MALAVAAAPSASRAKALAADAAWEELYLAFSSTNPAPLTASERKGISAALVKGCGALAGPDPVMGYSLAERAVAFHPTAEALLCLARTAIATDQRGAAEETLRRGLAAHPGRGEFGLLLAELLLEDQDPAGALWALGKVPRKSPQHGQAQALTERARDLQAQERGAEAQAVAVESQVRHAERPIGRAESLTYESGVGAGGVRTRSNRRFAFRYFSGERDFGQRADYEGQVAAALEKAYQFTRRTLGEARESQVEVILYSREEFHMHHGARMAARVAGFYSEGAIRVNDAAAIDAANSATLVHEYVHAVVDDLAGGRGGLVPTWVNEGLAEYVEWQFQGYDHAPVLLANQMRGAALKGQLPSLASFSEGGPLAGQPNAALRYAVAASAVKLLLANGGPENLLALVREVGRGQPFEKVFQARYTRGLTRFQEELQAELGHP